MAVVDWACLDFNGVGLYFVFPNPGTIRADKRHAGDIADAGHCHLFGILCASRVIRFARDVWGVDDCERAFDHGRPNWAAI